MHNRKVMASKRESGRGREKEKITFPLIIPQMTKVMNIIYRINQAHEHNQVENQKQKLTVKWTEATTL